VKPQNAWAAKGEIVEEWIDIHFFRPLGYLIARAAGPTRVSPDHLTLVCLILGLAAGHLFFYSNPWFNVAGFLLFIVSDIFDSADGQLARMRGTSTRFGRILDGVSDNLRFINLYLTVMVRLRMAGWGWTAMGLATLAGASHSVQSAGVDFIRQAFLFLGREGRGELELIDDVPAEPRAPWWRRLGVGLYRDYLRNQERLFPQTFALVRRAREESPGETFQAAYVEAESGVVRNCAWIGQNIRFVLVAAACLAGRPAAFFWITAVPFTLILVTLRALQERNAARLAVLLPTEIPEPVHAA